MEQALKDKIAKIIYDNMFERTWRNAYEALDEIEKEINKMSTDFFEVCEQCLNGEKHFHRKNDRSVAHRFFGGESTGTQVTFTGTMSDATTLVSERGDVVTVGELKAQVGAGKKE